MFTANSWTHLSNHNYHDESINKLHLSMVDSQLRLTWSETETSRSQLEFGSRPAPKNDALCKLAVRICVRTAHGFVGWYLCGYFYFFEYFWTIVVGRFTTIITFTSRPNLPTGSVTYHLLLKKCSNKVKTWRRLNQLKVLLRIGCPFSAGTPLEHFSFATFLSLAARTI